MIVGTMTCVDPVHKGGRGQKGPEMATLYRNHYTVIGNDKRRLLTLTAAFGTLLYMLLLTTEVATIPFVGNLLRVAMDVRLSEAQTGSFGSILGNSDWFTVAGATSDIFFLNELRYWKSATLLTAIAAVVGFAMLQYDAAKIRLRSR